MSLRLLPALRLTTALSLLILAFSRASLLAHEFLGHGGAAVSLGGTITDYRLFLFAGGRIAYHRAEPYGFAERLFVSTGGITVELLLAAVAVLVARRLRPCSLARFGLCAYATGNAVHALYYLAVGIHYGIADGAMIHALLSPSQRALAIAPLVILTGGAAYLGARMCFAQLWPQLAPFRRPRLVLALSLFFALAVHGGLSLLSLKLEQDRSYATLMRPQVERRADRWLTRARAERERRGQTLSDRELARLRRRFVREHRPWPLRPLLVVVIAAAGVLAGWRRGRADGADPALAWSWRSVTKLAGILALLLALVWMLRAPAW